nr:hypothetical protein BaRGS_011300 [Batillaria attramentaria]
MQCVNMMIVLVVLMLALLWEVRTDRIRVYCDNDTAGGGWTVIQRRINGSVDFYRGWEDYENGFGDVTGEFWLGLLNIHRLTSSKNYTLRVDLEDFDGKTAYTEYSNFRISGPDQKYRLSIGGSRGNAGRTCV